VKRYHVDLTALQLDGEVIYRQLTKLLGPMPLDQQLVLILGSGKDETRVVFTIVERTPYTSLIAIDPQRFGRIDDGLHMQVRAYHDAEIAEVIRCNDTRRFITSYQGLLQIEFSVDEKEQLNQFLREWLSHCLQHGRSGDDPMDQLND